MYLFYHVFFDFSLLFTFSVVVHRVPLVIVLLMNSWFVLTAFSHLYPSMDRIGSSERALKRRVNNPNHMSSIWFTCLSFIHSHTFFCSSPLDALTGLFILFLSQPDCSYGAHLSYC